MPPAVGRAAAISARTRETMQLNPPTMVQLAKAAFGPPVYMTQPKRTGFGSQAMKSSRPSRQKLTMPDMKFIVEKVAAQLSKNPKERMNSCL